MRLTMGHPLVTIAGTPAYMYVAVCVAVYCGVLRCVAVCVAVCCRVLVVNEFVPEPLIGHYCERTCMHVCYGALQ